MSEGPRVLIVTSRYYARIAEELEAGVTDGLDAAGVGYDFLEVPGAFEIPAAIALATQSGEYDGYVALGCVLRGQTSHYDLICTEVARALMDLSLTGVPLAFGVLTCESEDQAWARASRSGKNKGREVVDAVVRMMELSQHFSAPVEE
jgi:6,7-dimethyl-8-ribityllumazine synthase